MPPVFPRVYIRAGREFQIQRLHPWVFSGAIERIEGACSEGVIVAVYSSVGERLGYGHFAESSIAVKMFLFGADDFSEDVWLRKLQDACAMRRRFGLPESGKTNAYRLVHAEGDGLPGLVIDIFAATAVVEFHSEGMRSLQQVWADLVPRVMPEIERVLFRDDVESGTLEETVEILENGNRLLVPLNGQKTGYFLDQAANRLAVQRLCRDRRVLDCFCYTGGFAVAALAGGAKRVTCVDSSERALACAGENMRLQAAEETRVRLVKADCLQWLHDPDEMFDVVILDPPAFVKSRKALQGGLRGYETINRLALQHMPAEGLLFTFSCSQLVSAGQFEEIVRNAAARAGRFTRVVERFGQAASHPYAVSHPEGFYLKGLLLYVS